MAYILDLIVFSSIVTHTLGDSYGGLYPRESVSREVRNLDGLWDFRLAPLHDPDQGFREEWYLQPLRLTGDTIKMAVPSSYNDITQSKELRDHVGWAWYDTQFYIPERWLEDDLRIVIRFGSACYYSTVYVNGNKVISHEVGHLPFMAEINDYVNTDSPNLLTVCVNNTLSPLTIPQGWVTYQTDTNRYPEGYYIQNYHFDFFNYAGIHRPVYLYTTPSVYIEDVTVTTNIGDASGFISYDVVVNGSSSQICAVKVYDEDDGLVGENNGCSGAVSIVNPHLWWPYLMSENPGYLYNLVVNASDSSGLFDIYTQKVGIRTVEWGSDYMRLNGVPLYLRGCGKHEDAFTIGKGVSYPNIVKDFSLLKWLGANSFRTSHYPYAEEIMDMADAEGIMVIDESPGVDLTDFGDELLAKHKTIMSEMYRRDKNRPSVIMWSLANEANTDQDAAESYFQEVANYTRGLDSTRPVTAAINKDISIDKAAQSLDVILINKYYGWYTDTGHYEVIELQVRDEVTKWYEAHQKPIGMSEYGAGTIVGSHTDPAWVWSEEYQARLMYENFKAFDQLRTESYFFGEMIWNFADFATQQGTDRPGGNKKGIFTRDRQPKLSAHVLRERYHELANGTKTSESISYKKIFQPRERTFVEL